MLSCKILENGTSRVFVGNLKDIIFTNVKHKLFFFQNFLEDISPFCGPLIPLFWTSGDGN